MAIMMSLNGLLLIIWCVSAAENVTLTTKLGQVTGTLSYVNGTKVQAYLGIPYAKPPVGDLRFSKPQPYGVFGKLNATDYPPACVQQAGASLYGQEDCLTLNIFSPVGNLTNKRKAVMVWLHGGGLERGQGQDWPGHILAASGDVIVVTIQYRLNIFGFLTTGDSRLPGNLGLWDQHLALNWIKSNIADYGGNASSVTLFGNSAGATAVMFQAFSVRNNASLFQRVIVQSAWLPSPDMVDRQPQNLTSMILKPLNCSLNNEILSCLRTKTKEQLLDAYNSAPAVVHKSFPISDNDFLPLNIAHAVKTFAKQGSKNYSKDIIGNFGQYDLLGGWAEQEGLVLMSRVLQTSKELTGKDLELGITEQVLVKALSESPFGYIKDQEMRNFAVETFKNYYLLDPKPSPSNGRTVEDQMLEAYRKIAGDAIYKFPSLNWIQVHSLASSNKSYAYEYRHKRASPTYLYFEGPSWLRTSANHADEMYYLLGLPFYNETKNLSLTDRVKQLLTNFNFTQADRQVSRFLISSWSNFAKTGDPGTGFQEFSYPREQSYTAISSDGPKTLTYPSDEYLRLWASVTATAEAVDKDSNITKRMDIVANYTVTCNTFNNFESIINSEAKNKYANIERLTAGECTRTEKYQTNISCTKNIMTVSWPTNCIYKGYSVKAKELLMETNKKLRSIKDELNMAIPSRILPVIQPLVQSGVIQVAAILTSLH